MSSIIRNVGFFVLGLAIYLPGFANNPTAVIPADGPLALAAHAQTSSTPKKIYHGGFAQQRPAAGVPVFIFSPAMHAWALYNPNGILLKTGAASGGKNYCPDVRRACRTPTGTFHVFAKKGANCKSSKYPVGKGGAPMPYCTFFTKNHAIHGSYDVRPYNASHGCIRVYPADAKWIQRNLPYGSIVIVRPY